MEEEQDIEEDRGHYVRFRTLIFNGLFKTSFRGVDRHLGTEISWNRVDLQSGLVNEDKMLTEVKVLQAARHPNVVEFYDSWHSETNGIGSLVYISEVFFTGSLKQFLKKARKIKTKVVQTWCKQLLEALNHLHSLDPPVVHRDVKCDNVFITPSGELKLGDLGLVTKNHDTYFSIFGTLEFLAPECLIQESATEKTDIWSFGMSVIEMITGEYPYGEFSSSEALKAIYGGTKPAILEKMKATKSPFLPLINKCLVQAEERPSAKLLLQYLSNLHEDDSTIIELPSHQERATGSVLRNPYLVFVSKIDGEFRIVDASSDKRKPEVRKIETEISQKIATPGGGHGSSHMLNASAPAHHAYQSEPSLGSSSKHSVPSGSLPRTNSFERAENAFRVVAIPLDDKPTGNTLRVRVTLSSPDFITEFDVLFDASKEPADIYEDVSRNVLALELKKSSQFLHDLKKIILSHIIHAAAKFFPDYKSHSRARDHHKERDHHSKDSRDRDRDHHHSHHHHGTHKERDHHGHHSTHSHSKDSHITRNKNKPNTSLPPKALQRKLSNNGSSSNLLPKSPPTSPRSKKPTKSPANSRPPSPPIEKVASKRETIKKTNARKKMRPGAENLKLSQAKKLQALEQQLFDEALHVEALLYANTFMAIPHDTTSSASDAASTNAGSQSTETREFLQYVLKQLFPSSPNISNSSSQLTTPSASAMVTPIGSRSSSPTRSQTPAQPSGAPYPVLEDLLSQVHLNQSNGVHLNDSSQLSESFSPKMNCSDELDIINQKNDSPNKSTDEYQSQHQKTSHPNGHYFSATDEGSDHHHSTRPAYHSSISSEELEHLHSDPAHHPNISPMVRPISPAPTSSFITHLPSSVFSPPTSTNPPIKPTIGPQPLAAKRRSNEISVMNMNGNNVERISQATKQLSKNNIAENPRNGMVAANGVSNMRNPHQSHGELKKANEMMSNSDLSTSQSSESLIDDLQRSQDIHRHHQNDLDNKLVQATDITNSVTGAEWS